MYIWRVVYMLKSNHCLAGRASKIDSLAIVMKEADGKSTNVVSISVFLLYFSLHPNDYTFLVMSAALVVTYLVIGPENHFQNPCAVYGLILLIMMFLVFLALSQCRKTLIYDTEIYFSFIYLCIYFAVVQATENSFS